MKKVQKGCIQWYLPNKKKPFAYSTKAEADAIRTLLEDFGDLRYILLVELILSPQERLIMQTYVDNGVYKPNIM